MSISRAPPKLSSRWEGGRRGGRGGVFDRIDLLRRRCPPCPSASVLRPQAPPPTPPQPPRERDVGEIGVACIVGDLFYGIRVAFCFPVEMNGVGVESGGVTSRKSLTERVIRKGREAIPVGRIPADPRGLDPKPGRGGIKRTRPNAGSLPSSHCRLVIPMESQIS